MPAAREETPPHRVSRDDLATRLGALCPLEGIDLAGAVALPCPLPHRERWDAWVAAGRDGNLAYLTRDPAGRADPVRRNPWACTVLVFGQRYTDGWDDGSDGLLRDDLPWADRVARYARGRDYHDVLLQAIKRVVDGLHETWPDLKAHAATDTGPYLEREYAWLAGLGFLGKNTCLIHERLGSGLFLGVALTNLVVDGLPPGPVPQAEPLHAIVPRRRRPARRVLPSHCGTCTACVTACPTEALLPDAGGLDAHRCISTWTIEWRGVPPEGNAAAQGGLLFGCDICQAVCPWNRRAAARGGPVPLHGAYATDPDHAELLLADLVEITDDEFRRRFRRTPLWRAHPDGMRRNAATVLANLAAERDRKDTS